MAEGRLTNRGAKEMRAAFAKTILVVDEGSLASTVQARDLLRIANEFRIPRVVLVGDAKQLDAVDAGKPFAQLQAAGHADGGDGRNHAPARSRAETGGRGEPRGRDRQGVRQAREQCRGGQIRQYRRGGGGPMARPLDEARENTGVMAPSHELRQAINGHIRERLAREGRIHGPAMQAERLVSKGYTNAEKSLAGNYGVGDVVAFHRPYKRIGVGKGDERRVMGVDHKAGAVMLDDGKGGAVAWKPEEIGGRRGGSEVYRAEEIELRAGDRIRWTRNDAGLGLVNSRTADVVAVKDGRVTFRLEDGKTLELGKGDPQMRHLDHAWASTVHAFQGRTVDNVIAAMEARHPHLTTQKSFYVEISRARDRAELVTDDAAELQAQLQAVTGERIAALEGIGEMKREAPDRAADAALGADRGADREAGSARGEGAGDGRNAVESAREGAGSAGPRPRPGRHGPRIVTMHAWAGRHAGRSRSPAKALVGHREGGQPMSEDGRNEAAGGGKHRRQVGRRAQDKGHPVLGIRVGRGQEGRRRPRNAGRRVRPERLLELARAPEGVGPVPVAGSMAPLIERMFRYTWFLATEKRGEMLREGRGDEVDKLVAEARAFQQSLRGDACRLDPGGHPELGASEAVAADTRRMARYLRRVTAWRGDSAQPGKGLDERSSGCRDGRRKPLYAANNVFRGNDRSVAGGTGGGLNAVIG